MAKIEALVKYGMKQRVGGGGGGGERGGTRVGVLMLSCVLLGVYSML
jgi:hypothetical protein